MRWKILCCIGGLSLIGCREQPVPKPPPPPPLVKCAVATAGEYRPTKTQIAQVRPLKSIDVVARVSGFLTERNFVEGSYLPAGAALYLIDPTPYQIAKRHAEAALAQAKAQAGYADQNFARVAKLYREQVDDANEFDMAQASKLSSDANVQICEANLAQAEVNLGYTRITAPFAGWVGLTTCDVGNYVNAPSSALTTLQYIDEVRVSFQVSDDTLTPEELALLQQGKRPDWQIGLQFRDGSAYPLPGQLDFWNNQISPSTGTLQLEARFANPDRRLIPGQYVQITLTPTTPQPVLLLHELAIHDIEGGSFVYRITNDNRIAVQPVVCAGRVGNDRVVASGLQLHDRVVGAANVRLRDGMTVVVSPEPVR